MSARGYNTCILVGHLTTDPELRRTGTGTLLLIFRLTVSGAARSNGPTPGDTPYFRTMLWGNAAEAVHAHLTQGKRVRVDGRRENRKYTDPASSKNTNSPRSFGAHGSFWTAARSSPGWAHRAAVCRARTLRRLGRFHLTQRRRA